MFVSLALTGPLHLDQQLVSLFHEVHYMYPIKYIDIVNVAYFLHVIIIMQSMAQWSWRVEN